jgi:Putative DNA-binding domain
MSYGKFDLAVLQDILMNPHERLDVEFKDWLDPKDDGHKAKIAKALMALANFGGGILVLGIQEIDKGWKTNLMQKYPATFSQDDINGIVKNYAAPAFHCELILVQHPTAEVKYPFIRVPDNLTIPVRSKRDGGEVRVNRYYGRLPGPCSDELNERAWDELISRCVRRNKDGLLKDLIDVFQGSQATKTQELNALAVFNEQATARLKAVAADAYHSTYGRGTRTFSFAFGSTFVARTVDEIRDTLRQTRGETGWTPFICLGTHPPYFFDGLLECHIIPERVSKSHSDFWRASRTGNFTLIRPYDEDFSPGKMTPGSELDPVLTIWRVGDCALHAAKIADALGYSDSIELMIEWTGLSGRRLSYLDDRSRFDYAPPAPTPTRQDKVTVRLAATAASIKADLASFVIKATEDLYRGFGFFELSRQIVERELAKMQGR